MGVIRLYMTMSLDGFVVGPHDSVNAPMGVGGFRLFNWLDRRFDPGPNGQVFAEVNATRAVISGRRTYEQPLMLVDRDRELIVTRRHIEMRAARTRMGVSHCRFALLLSAPAEIDEIGFHMTPPQHGRRISAAQRTQ